MAYVSHSHNEETSTMKTVYTFWSLPASHVCPRGRKNVSPGTSVEVVQKQHQRTGELTAGVVSRLLTNSSFHPRGIKVCMGKHQAPTAENKALARSRQTTLARVQIIVYSAGAKTTRVVNDRVLTAVPPQPHEASNKRQISSPKCLLVPSKA